MRGEVKHRIPVSQANDEFDRLSENLNCMLEEIERLVGGIRAVTDNIADDLRSPLTRLKNRLSHGRKRQSGRATGGDPAGDPGNRWGDLRRLALHCRRQFGARRGDVDLGEAASDVVELHPPVAEGAGPRDVVQGAVAVKGNRQLLLQAGPTTMRRGRPSHPGRGRGPSRGAFVADDGPLPSAAMSWNASSGWIPAGPPRQRAGAQPRRRHSTAA